MAGHGSKPGERRGGRAKGTPNRTHISARLRIEREADPVGRLIDAARTGKLKLGEREDDLDADQYLGVLRELRKMVMPDAKSAPVRLDLPPLEGASDLVKAIAAIIAQLGMGNLAPDEAATIAGVLETKRRAIETADLEQRIAKLEAPKP